MKMSKLKPKKDVASHEHPVDSTVTVRQMTTCFVWLVQVTLEPTEAHSETSQRGEALLYPGKLQ